MKQESVDSQLEEAFERLRDIPVPESGRQAEQRRAFVAQAQGYRRRGVPASRRSRLRPAWRLPFGSRRAALAGALAALLLVVMAGTGVIYASDAAVPGDPLYGIDQTVESLRLGLTTRPEATAELLVSLAQERLAEAEELSSRGDSDNLAVALDGFGSAVAALADRPAGEAEADAAAVAALLDREFAPQAELQQASLPVLPVPELNQDGDDEEEGDELSGRCSGGAPEPAAERLADTYGVDTSQVMEWFCEGYGIGEIMLALQTAEKPGVDRGPGELLDLKSELGGWGQVWQQYHLIGKGHKDAVEEEEEQPEVEVVPDVKEAPPNTGNYCAYLTDPESPEPEAQHPVAVELESQFGVGYDQIMEWFCIDHLGMGEIKTMLEVAETAINPETDKLVTPGELLQLREELGGWGQVWHELGYNGKPKELEEDASGDQISSDIAGDTPGKGPGEKPPKVKPDAASKSKGVGLGVQENPGRGHKPTETPETPDE